jgi:hypothetical protein
MTVAIIPKIKIARQGIHINRKKRREACSGAIQIVAK